VFSCGMEKGILSVVLEKYFGDVMRYVRTDAMTQGSVDRCARVVQTVGDLEECVRRRMYSEWQWRTVSDSRALKF
jgi:hypothetical protein